MNHQQLLYTKVMDVEFSPDGQWLAASTNFGFMLLYRMKNTAEIDANTDTERSSNQPSVIHKVDTAMWSLASTSDFLLCGSTNRISGWRWDDVISKNCKPSWSVSLKTENPVSGAHANAIAVLNQVGDESQMVAACEDNMLYCYDLNSGELTRKLMGHTDYVHDVCTRNSGREVISASEDGTVRLWDLRTGNEVQRMEPGLNEECARPKLGNWMSCVSADPAGDWMVCGGGPSLALWHLRARSPTNVYAAGHLEHYRAALVGGSVFACSSDSTLRRWSLAAELRGELQTSAAELFALGISDSNLDTNTRIACGGAGSSIALSSGLGYSLASLMLAQ